MTDKPQFTTDLAPLPTHAVAQPRNPDDLLLLRAEPELGSAEKPIDNIVAPRHAVIHQLGLALITEHEQGWGLGDGDRRGKLDPCLAAVVEGAQRQPCRLVPRNPVVEIQPFDLDRRRNRLRRLGCSPPARKREQFVGRIGPARLVSWIR